MRITPKPWPIELDKRTYLPFEVTSTCPQCGAEITKDMTRHYLSYPATGKPEKMYFSHEAEGGEHDWHEMVIVGFTLEPAPTESP